MADDPASIERFLRGDPGFLAARPALYRALDPPQRVHGERLADHMEAMVRRERAHARQAQASADLVLAAGRARAAMQDRVEEAVLAALAAADLLDFIESALPAILGVDAAALCGENPRPRWRALPPGTVRHWLGEHAVRCRALPEGAALLHAEAAELAATDALIRLPLEEPALLALASRDAAALPASAARPLAFLGDVLAALLRR